MRNPSGMSHFTHYHFLQSLPWPPSYWTIAITLTASCRIGSICCIVLAHAWTSGECIVTDQRPDGMSFDGLMQTSCTIQRGFGFTTNFVGVVPCPPRAPRSLKQPRCITRTRLGLGDLANHLITKHLEHVNARGECQGWVQRGYEVTPIHATASVGHVNILSLLTEHGADVNGRGVRDKFSLQ